MTNKAWNAITQTMFEVRLMLQTSLIILIMLKLTSDLNITWFWALTPLWLWLLLTGSLTIIYFVLWLKDKRIAKPDEDEESIEDGSDSNARNALEKGA